MKTYEEYSEFKNQFNGNVLERSDALSEFENSLSQEELSKIGDSESQDILIRKLMTIAMRARDLYVECRSQGSFSIQRQDLKKSLGWLGLANDLGDD